MFDYFTNTGAYAKNCENKARPAMHCNGKCQMMKKLKQEDKKDAENSERKAENKNEVITMQQITEQAFYPVMILLQKHFPITKAAKTIKMPRRLLRPPIC